MKLLKYCFICLLFSIVVISCKKFQIPQNTILYTLYEKTNQESFLKQHLKENNKYVFLFIDMDCGVCMFELKWWLSFLDNHEKLNPLFVVNSTKNNVLELIILSDLKKYPLILDDNFKIIMENEIMSSRTIVIIDGSLNILFEGDPLHSNEFNTFYSKLK